VLQLARHVPWLLYCSTMRMLISNTTVIGEGGAVLPATDVIIDGGKYVGLLPTGKAQGPFDKSISGEGKILAPGLFNAHTHLAMTLFRGKAADMNLMQWLEEEIWPVEKKLTAEDVHWFSRLGLVEMIRSGTVGFADMYFFMDEVAQAAEEAGLRALLSYGIIAPSADRVEPELRKAEEFASAWNGTADGRITTAFSPHAPYTCGPELWSQATKLARELKIPIHTHLAETKEEVDRMREQTGRTPVEWLEGLGVFSVPTLAAHCVHVTEKDCNILAAHRVAVAHCPTSNARLACGIAPTTDLLNGGVCVALGTDGPGSSGSLDLLREMRMAAMLGKLRQTDPQAIGVDQTLAMASKNGAAALGLRNETGTIAEGKWADGILVARRNAHMIPGYSPLTDLVYSAEKADVEAVFVKGNMLMEGRRLLTLDEERITAKCRELVGKYR